MKTLFPNGKTKRGMTFLELMITISIISLGILGIFGLIQGTMRAAAIANARFKAAYFAQEGIEVVRNIRDSNWINENPWDRYEGEEISSLSLCGDCCRIPYNFEYGVDSITANCESALIENGFYAYGTGSESRFTRKIKVTNREKDEIPYLEVQVEVFGTERGEDFSVKVTEHLYNWR